MASAPVRYTLEKALNGDYGDDVKAAAEEIKDLSEEHLERLADGQFKGTPLCHGCADKLAGIQYATDLNCTITRMGQGGKAAWRSCMLDDEPYRAEELSTPLDLTERNIIVPQLAKQLLPPPPIPYLAALAAYAVPPDADTSRLGPFDSLKATERAERVAAKHKKTPQLRGKTAERVGRIAARRDRTPYSRSETARKKGGRRRTYRKKRSKRKRTRRTRTNRRRLRS